MQPLIAVAGVFWVCFLGFFGYAAIRWMIITSAESRRYEQAANWNSAEGKIINSRFRRIPNWMEVSYSYYADGERQGFCRIQEPGVKMRGRYTVDPESLQRHNAEVAKDIETYPSGGSVTVKYNPSKPDESVLWY
jgi:hypothetical protein